MAFKRLYGGDDRYRMIIKCRDSARWLTGLMDPQISLVEGEQTDAEYHALLERCDAMVFPSRGEGFGLPPREATLSGLPTIAMAWLGMWDVAQWGYALPVRELRPALFDTWDANADGSLWAEPDTTALERQMQTITLDYAAALETTRAGRDYLLRGFNWRAVAGRIHQLLWEHA